MGRFVLVSLGWLVAAFSLPGAKGCCCPRDWFPMNSLCYKVFEEKKNWNNAEMFCRKHKPGCHLASIHSLAESADLAEYIADYITKKDIVWIGLNDPRKTRSWEWSDRSCVDYLSWQPGEPSNSGNNEYCVHLYPQADYKKWNDIPCDTACSFICQCKF
ncbi:C-type lectin mannose-binding isoform-like [Pseudonaja textilis]|uniref:C-type lectin mannose-binding isoform-like n=1 Tax=Pseudonaja textilis TaxID=8673 RepID=UPI000EA8E26A|nr:C-type lectin mannose-binding isoform-like [Pseudonaja textilis]